MNVNVPSYQFKIDEFIEQILLLSEFDVWIVIHFKDVKYSDNTTRCVILYRLSYRNNPSHNDHGTNNRRSHNRPSCHRTISRRTVNRCTVNRIKAGKIKLVEM